jgi:hypothetical protein
VIIKEGFPMNDIKKTIRELNLEDDFLFSKVMADNEICKRVLEQILNISIEKVVSLYTQRTIDMLLEGKGVRLDVYVNDNKGTVYNVEMQRAKNKDLAKRTRYYQGNIDLDLISSGKPYNDLRKTYIIFICTFDFFNDGRHIYTFENICRENQKISLGDETTKIFLNTAGTRDDISSDMRDFLTYIENTSEEFAFKSQNRLLTDIQKKVDAIKSSKETEVEYMTLLERDRENRELGSILTLNIIKLYNKGMDRKQIAKELHIDIEIVDKIINNYEEM